MTFTRRWFGLLLMGAVPLVASLYSPGFAALALVWDGGLLAATLIDYLLLPSPAHIEVERQVEPQLSLGAANLVRLVVRNAGRRACRVTVHDEPPEAMAHAGAESEMFLPRGGRAALEYHVTPRARGEHRFGDIWLRVGAPLGLLRRQWRVPASAPVRVFPSLLETARFTLMARRGQLQQAGIRAARLVGAGREFESLRDYQPDDEYRRVDWKATARRGRLTSRQYEVERSQNVIIALDVGRTMLAEIDGVAKLDYAVNAALLLAYVAALADDRVGLLVFADETRAWVAPRKGRSQVYQILQALYDVQARRVEPDYRSAFGGLAGRWRRRSLVVCFTDLWDPESSRQTIAEMAALQPRHLVACVTMMDSTVARRAEAPLEAAADVYARAVALEVLDGRARATAALARRGVLVVDTPADRLSAAVVNRYLEVKERLLL